MRSPRKPPGGPGPTLVSTIGRCRQPSCPARLHILWSRIVKDSSPDRPLLTYYKYIPLLLVFRTETGRWLLTEARVVRDLTRRATYAGNILRFCLRAQIGSRICLYYYYISYYLLITQLLLYYYSTFIVTILLLKLGASFQPLFAIPAQAPPVRLRSN